MQKQTSAQKPAVRSRRPSLAFHVAAFASLVACGAAGAGTAGVEVPPAASTIQVSIRPRSAALAPGGSIALVGAVTGTIDTSMVWSLEEGPSGGEVTGTGVYTAPQAEGSYHVVVASRVDPTRNDRATVVVAAAQPPPPPPSGTLAGVGWTGSTSLVDYPKTGPVTSGGPIVDIDDGAGGKTPAQRFNDALALLSSNSRVLIRNSSGAPVMLTARITRSTAWTSKKEVFAYGTQRIKLDASNVTSVSPLKFTGSREHWKGFEVTGANVVTGGWNGVVQIQNASFITIEDFWIHGNTGGGGSVWISSGTDILVQDTVAWRMGDGVTVGSDTPDGYSASGQKPAEPDSSLACTPDGTPNQSVPSRRVHFVRAVAINGADDSFDLYTAYDSDVIDSVSINPGQYWNGTVSGDGYGFKMGGGPSCGNNTVKGSIAVGGKMGASFNNMEHGIRHIAANNTAYGAQWNGFSYYDSFETGQTFAHVVANNISYSNGMNATYWMAPNFNKNANNRYQDLMGPTTVQTLNSWNPPNSTSSTAVSPDPQFADPANGDFSLCSNAPSGPCAGRTSPFLRAGPSGAALGASTIALQLLKDNWTRR